MNIKVRLFATLRDGRGKEMDMEMSDSPTPGKIMDILKINYEEVSLLLINGRDGELDRVLNDGDIVSMFPPVGGG